MSRCSSCEQLKNDDYRDDKRCLAHRLDQRVGEIHGISGSVSYEFVDYSTGKPVQIIGKRHWRQYLKENGLTDDASFSRQGGTLKNRAHEFARERMRHAIEQGVAEGFKRHGGRL